MHPRTLSQIVETQRLTPSRMLSINRRFPSRQVTQFHDTFILFSSKPRFTTRRISISKRSLQNGGLNDRSDSTYQTFSAVQPPTAHKSLQHVSHRVHHSELCSIRLWRIRNCHNFDPTVVHQAHETRRSAKFRSIDRSNECSLLCWRSLWFLFCGLVEQQIWQEILGCAGKFLDVDLRSLSHCVCQPWNVHCFSIPKRLWVSGLMGFSMSGRNSLIRYRSFIILASVPLWVAELAPPRIRGMLTDVHAVGMMVGYTLACYVGLGFYFVSGNNQWRGPIALQMALPTIILCGLYWMPESPRFLLSKGRTDQAWMIINRMHSNVNDPTDEFAKREFYQMRKQIELDVTFETSYLGIFKQPSLRKRAIMTIFLEFCLMSSGVLVILSECFYLSDNVLH